MSHTWHDRVIRFHPSCHRLLSGKSCLVMLLLLTASLTAQTASPNNPPSGADSAAILVYHRFSAIAADSTTVRTSLLERHLEFLRNTGYTVVRLRDVVNFVSGRGQLPPRAVAITVDDGHRSVFTEMKPVIEKYNVPVTLFVYPSAISNADYAMTWEELEELRATGLFDIGSHTYSHPNFRLEKQRRSPGDYQQLVESQLLKSRRVLEDHLGAQADLLAWPFGIYDKELISAAEKEGYLAGFTIERRKVSRQDSVMAIPRFIITDNDTEKLLAELLASEAGVKSHSENRPGHAIHARALKTK